MLLFYFFFFFFSSRRRHTRCLSDWSSDVCSSDLDGFRPKAVLREGWVFGLGANNMKSGLAAALVAIEAIVKRSEERRVGKECRSRWEGCHEKEEGSGRVVARDTGESEGYTSRKVV